MKRILFVCAVALMFTLHSCYDDYKSDFEFTSTYFAMQSPLRTLVIEEGQDLSLEVGAVLSGKYSNGVDEVVEFKIDPSMLDYVDGLEVLPESYYSISNNSEFVIKSGEILGTAEVVLNEAFINDPLSATVHYALPLKLTSTTADSLLAGKDSTIVAIRYQNKYYGSYRIKGVDYTLDESSNPIDTMTAVYSNPDLVNNIYKIFGTIAADTSLVPYIGADVSGNNSMKFGIKEDGSLTIHGATTAKISEVSGTGMYNEDEKIFTLDYTYTKTDTTSVVKHHVMDTLYYFHTPLQKEEWTHSDHGIIVN